MLKGFNVETYKESKAICEFTTTLGVPSVADLDSKISDTRVAYIHPPTPVGPIFFIFMQFSGNFGRMIGWQPHPGSTPHYGLFSTVKNVINSKA